MKYFKIIFDSGGVFYCVANSEYASNHVSYLLKLFKMNFFVYSETEIKQDESFHLTMLFRTISFGSGDKICIYT